MNCRRKPEQALGFEDAARFNRVLDTDETLQDGLAELAAQLPHLTDEDYTARLLHLLHNAGLDITVEEFKALLALRRQLDQRLLREEDDSIHQNKLPKNTLSKEVEDKMIKLQKVFAFGKRWGLVVISSVALILSVILLLLFPRKEHLALSTIFAITFWMSFIACVWQAVVLIRRYCGRNQKKIRTKPGARPPEMIQTEKSSEYIQNRREIK